MNIISNVLPLSCRKRFFTFSRTNAFGCFSFNIRAISKNSVPRDSLNPLRFPEILKAWQGNPPKRISWLGISFSFIFVISPSGFSPWLTSYVLAEFLSHSELNTHLPLFSSAAILNPPIPANKSINFIFSSYLFFLII